MAGMQGFDPSNQTLLVWGCRWIGQGIDSAMICPSMLRFDGVPFGGSLFGFRFRIYLSGSLEDLAIYILVSLDK
jgi:hypothetical protein